MDDEDEHRPDSVRRASRHPRPDPSGHDRRTTCKTPASTWPSPSKRRGRSSARVRTGRASPTLLDRIVVDYYGAQTPLKQLATVNAPEARLLTIQPYDKSSMKAIERAIQESDLGLTPNNDGSIIRLQIPDMTEERRREMVKVARHVAEEGRVAIRNIRRDVMHDLRELRDAGETGSDDEHRAEAGAAEAHRRADRRDRRRAEGQRGRDPRGVSASGGARHVAIITDGNGRWASAARARRRRGPPGRRRHRQGAAARRRRPRRARADRLLVLDGELVRARRTRSTALMSMFAERIVGETPELGDEGVRMRFVGRREGVDPAADRADGLGGAARRPPTTASRCSSPSTTAAGPRSSTPRAASPARPRRSSARACTRRTCTTRTC